MITDTTAAIEQAIDIIANCTKICIFTGAGISSESGIPTFRDKQTGLWENYRAEDLANVAAFKRNPKFVWAWYQWRRKLVADKLPNPAHYALAKWQKHANTHHQSFTLITQNVDNLHEQAGSVATHLHGHLWQNRCSVCHQSYDDDIDYEDDSLLACPSCGGWIRPNIVWFGEILPQHAWHSAEKAASDCDAFLSIGTSSLVYPAAGLSKLAKQCRATLIEINPNPTNSPHIDVIINGKAGVVLPKLVDGLSLT